MANKPEAILFYNEQCCGDDIVNRMLKDISNQAKNDNWTISAFTFLLDLATINGETILKYNQPDTQKCRRVHVASLVRQLAAPWWRRRYALSHLKADTKEALKKVPKTADPEFVFDETAPAVKPPGVAARCFLCINDLKKSSFGR